MKPGDVIHVQAVQVATPHGWASYKARPDGQRKVKGETPVFILLVLGTGTLEEPLDPNAAMKALGWTPPEDADVTPPGMFCDRCGGARDVHVHEWVDHQGRKVRAGLCAECWETVQGEGADAGLAAGEEREGEGRP